MTQILVPFGPHEYKDSFYVIQEICLMSKMDRLITKPIEVTLLGIYCIPHFCYFDMGFYNVSHFPIRGILLNWARGRLVNLLDNCRELLETANIIAHSVVKVGSVADVLDPICVERNIDLVVVGRANTKRRYLGWLQNDFVIDILNNCNCTSLVLRI
jgi:nucleotide-binding universal stress UspA family protein